MSESVIEVHNLSKQYRLGIVGTGTMVHDVNRWWHKMLGKEDPYLLISETNDRTEKGKTEYVWSLKDINFTIKQGDVVGIIGRNGAGKSTLLKILSRTTAPTTGSVKIKGRVASLLEVGTGFHPELTGRENIFLNGAILGMTKREIKTKFDEIVDFSGVERYIDTPVKRYSSGMYVRLAFAVAAHLESEILIVDEVLAVGDAEFQKKCLGKMGEVSKGEGRTVLFVSHNIQAISSICQRGIILQNGRIHTDDEIKICVNNYFNLTKDISLKDPISFKDRLSRTNGIVQFNRISGIKDSEENKTWAFSFDEEIEFKVECEVNQDADGLTFYMALSDLVTDTIITNIKSVITVDKLSKGEKRSFMISVPAKSIRPGQYNLYFALGDRKAKIWYDVIDGNVNLPALIVMPISLDPHENTGFISIPFSVKIDELKEKVLEDKT